jgi:hypothetical protein
MCANCIVREGLSCGFNGWGIDCDQCAQAKRGHCSFKINPQKRIQTTSRLYDASMLTSCRKFFYNFCLLILVLLTCLSLDIGRLWEQATLSLATYNQLAIVANSQISEAHRATLKILNLVGYAAATEPFLGLAGSMTLPEGMDFLYSLIALVSASDLPDEITEAARSMLSFGFFEDLPQEESTSEEEEGEEEGDDGGDQGIPIEN